MYYSQSELNPRRRAILGFIIGSYIRTATPVASLQVAQMHNLDVSPATVRNDMAALEKLGFISRPHASAGAVPSDRAYRFYVEHITTEPRLPRSVPEQAQSAIHVEEGDIDSWARGAAVVLSQAVRNVAISTAPRVSHARVKQLQLVQLQDRQALLLVVMQEARVRQHLVVLEPGIDQLQLNDLSTHLNTLLAGKDANEIQRIWHSDMGSGPLANLVVEETLHLLRIEDQALPSRPYLEGLSRMLGQPEFAGGTRAQQAVEALEDEGLLSYYTQDVNSMGDIQVLIGTEQPARHLREFGAVLSQYGVPGTASGVIGAIGPIRMDYSRAISSVRYLSKFMSALVASLEESGPRSRTTAP